MLEINVVQELFLYSGEEEEEGEDNMNSSRSHSHTHSYATETPHKTPVARRNKQFQGYQSIMSGGIRRYGDTFSALHSSEKNARAGGGRVGKLQPDEALVETWQASDRKRKMIVLSDDEDEPDEEERNRAKARAKVEGESLSYVF